ncbi:MAG: hypothetical protein IPJ84_20620 [Bdellovibrionales bacterium]|nr:hypothetical protein [Bdellovibrionales bacterium]
MSRLSRTLVFLLFLAPYVFSLIVAQGRMALPAGFLGLVQSSFLQAALSALFAVTLGILTGVGLLGLPQRLRRSTEAAVLVGSFVPSIAWVLMWMVLLPNVRGVTAIVILHAVSSAGLIASAVVRKVRTRWAGSLELAMVEGAPRGLMWRRGLLPLLRSDLVTYLLTIFASSLSSFSIPLLMGGAEAWTFEIAIHQAVRIHSAWDQVAALTLWQWITLTVLLFVSRSRVPLRAGAIDHRESRAVEKYGWKPLVLLGVMPVASVLIVLLSSALRGVQQLETAGLLIDGGELGAVVLVSIFVAHLGGLLTAATTLFFALSRPSETERRLLSSYVAPSAVITGLMLLLVGMGSVSALADALRISFGCALVFAPVLWRMRWHVELSTLERQVEVAEIFGASAQMIAWRILWPQLRPLFYWTWGVATFWAFGDYAIGAVAASRPITLALLSRALLESYRLEAAAILIGLGLFLGFLSYLFFSNRGERNVGRKVS